MTSKPALQTTIFKRRVYDDFRTVHMSREYYACKLSRFRKINLAYEIVLAVTASATIGGWYIWETPSGRLIWAIYAGFVAVLAVIKPILQIPKEIEKYSKLHVGYSDLFYDYRQLVDQIQSNNIVTSEITTAESQAQKRYVSLALNDDAVPSARLLAKCQKKTNQTYDVFDIWQRKYDPSDNSGIEVRKNDL